MRAGLRKHWNAEVARFDHMFQRLLGGEMHKVHRGFGEFGKFDAAMCRLAFHDGRTRKRVIARRRMTLGDGFANQQVDHSAVFGVQCNHAAMLTHHPHGLKNRRIVRHHRAGVRHEHLEARHPLVADRVLHVAEDLVVNLRDDHMKGIVDAGNRRRFRLRACNCIKRTGAGVLQRKVDDRGGAAERGRAGAGGEVVAGDRGPEGILHVRVGVHAAREHQQAARVDHLGVGSGFELLSDTDDPSAFDHDIGNIVVDGCNQASSTYQRACRVMGHELLRSWSVARAKERASSRRPISAVDKRGMGGRIDGCGNFPSRCKQAFRRAFACEPGAVP